MSRRAQPRPTSTWLAPRPRARTLFAYLLLAWLLWPGVAAAQVAATEASAREEAEQRLRSYMETQQIPGLSVAVAREGRLLWAQGFGVADLESGVPVTPSTAFPLGSTTKTLTTAAMAMLVEEGRLDLDAPIQTYVPYFPRKRFPITARQLAGHQAGIRDYDMAAGEYANVRRFASIRDAVSIFADSPLLFEPGTGYHYSAYGFVLLSAVIEGAAGMDFRSYLRSKILAPLRLRLTGPNVQPGAMPGLVTSYARGFFGTPVPAPHTDLSNKWAAGGYVSTPAEMVRFGSKLLSGSLLRPATWGLITTPQQLADGSANPEGYAMGWRSGSRWFPSLGRATAVLHHGGLGNGSMAFLLLVPEYQLVVCLQSNLLSRPVAEFIREAYAVADRFLEGSGSSQTVVSHR